MSDHPNQKDEGSRPPTVTFHYIKSNLFRVIHVDGAWGGPTPRGDVEVAFWSERVPIPQQMVHKVNDDGTIGDELKEERIARDGLVREVETLIIMNIVNAKALLAFLQRAVKQAEELPSVGGETK